MSESRPTKTRVSLTKPEIQNGIGAELFSLCQAITADGKLSKDEIVALGLWLRDNKEAPLPGVSFLSEILNRIIAGGRVTRDEQRELMEAIEKVLPPESRKEAKAARRAVEAERKEAVKAAREEQRRRERETEEKRWPEDEFDFMVAGVHFEGRHRIIERFLSVGDRVRMVPDPDNPHDECAVAITLTNGRKIGYVPREHSADVSGCLEDCGYYVATVKKILTGGRVPIPVVVLKFFRQEQLDDIAELNPDPCPVASSSSSHSVAQTVSTSVFSWFGGAAHRTTRHLLNTCLELWKSHKIIFVGSFSSIGGVALWTLGYLFDKSLESFSILRPTGVVTLFVGLGILSVGIVFSLTESHK